MGIFDRNKAKPASTGQPAGGRQSAAELMAMAQQMQAQAMQQVAALQQAFAGQQAGPPSRRRPARCPGSVRSWPSWRRCSRAIAAGAAESSTSCRVPRPSSVNGCGRKVDLGSAEIPCPR